MTKHAQRLVEEAYAQACTQALALVEQEARAILRQTPRLQEFVMGMGRWFFTNTQNEPVEHAPSAWARPLTAFIDAWDAKLKLTGHPMRFTAEGAVVRDW